MYTFRIKKKNNNNLQNFDKTNENIILCVVFEIVLIVSVESVVFIHFPSLSNFQIDDATHQIAALVPRLLRTHHKYLIYVTRRRWALNFFFLEKLNSYNETRKIKKPIHDHNASIPVTSPRSSSPPSYHFLRC